MTPSELFRQIASACPSFAAQIAEHVADHDEILPHVLMGDVRLLVESCLMGSTSLVVGGGSQRELQAVLDVLDRGLQSGDDATQNVVAVSFVEHLWLEPWFERLAPLLGPALSAEIVRQRNWPTSSA